ncbi:urease accessory protein UreF [Qingshengfaniella alkalisoli]|uniref:Urease accessory protein UreF n=1 Tax=Qingshengfaniella alkalisoli TaxID=2599296 RepID=A0A5B8IVS1_9RHOB|nr:urease accessory UreF family protein [Qingshengfaniella alkalisoli]QDY68971.1 urease accessory protein UreF [Qingshengfaniella alkalisoli]
MSTDSEDLLTLTQWLSPGFPIGSFAYSHGLDWQVDAGAVSDAEDLRSWLRSTLRNGAAFNDGVILAMAHRGDCEVAELISTARALAASKERLTETLDQGRAFLRLTNDILGTKIAETPLPVAVGLQARNLAVETEQVVALYLQAFISNLVTIAVRIVPLGQTAGQQVLFALRADISQTAVHCAQGTLDDLGSCVLLSDLASIQHETQPVRLFLT